MAATTIAQAEPELRVTAGVDTHKDFHVGAVKDQLGRTLAHIQVPSTGEGYEKLLNWARSFGEIEAWGVEGTGSYGAGLTRSLRARGQVVIEVNRPDRAARRRNGKSDPVDAEAAARAVQSGDAYAAPKAGDDKVEMIRMLRIARSGAVSACTDTANAMHAIVVTAPQELRDELRNLTTTRLVRTAACFESAASIVDTTGAAGLALGTLARRYESLEAQIKTLDKELDRLTQETAPALRDLFGVGPDTAGQLLVTAGDNPDRLKSEASFSNLCGTSPIEASSGNTQRHRLNRGGDRQANSALHRIVIVRLRWDKRTRTYMERRLKEGKTKKEIIRCLKRYVAREIFTVLRDTHRENATQDT